MSVRALRRVSVVCICMCVSLHSHTFWTSPSSWLDSPDVWLSYNKYQEAKLDSFFLRSSLVHKNGRECWWPLNTFWSHQPNLGPDKYAKKGSLLTIPLNAFPSPAVSCCPVTRCRGRQVYLVWQVTPHPKPPQSHVSLIPVQQPLHQVTEDRMHFCLNASHTTRSSFAYWYGLFPPGKSLQRNGSCLADTFIDASVDSFAATPISWVSGSKRTRK